MSVIQFDLNEEQFEEGNYSMTVSCRETQVVRRNEPEWRLKGTDASTRTL